MSQTGGFFWRLRRFDAYPKTLEDFSVKTCGGAAVTIIAAVFMTLLFLHELRFYLTKEVTPELFVDVGRVQKLRINVDITFPKVSCNYLTVDAMDVTGESQIDVDHSLYKIRLDLEGKVLDDPQREHVGSTKKEEFKKATKGATEHGILDPSRCESCYGAETEELKCCNTCDDVRESYRRKGWAFTDAETIAQCQREGYSQKMKDGLNEGCRLYGKIQVNKVAGNFHIAPGKSFQQSHVHVHDVNLLQGIKFNMTHTISHLSFGQDYPGLINPLDKSKLISETESEMVQYFVKIVPTTYVKTDDETVHTNQYSVTKHVRKQSSSPMGESSLPGVFFIYELSPIMVKYTESHRSFMHFLTGVCAIIGGVFTVAGIVDSFIYHSAKLIQKKMELGKLT